VGAQDVAVVHTVHDYVKALHSHFGVSSRTELLARWLQTGGQIPRGGRGEGFVVRGSLLVEIVTAACGMRAVVLWCAEWWRRFRRRSLRSTRINGRVVEGAVVGENWGMNENRVIPVALGLEGLGGDARAGFELAAVNGYRGIAFATTMGN